MHELATAVYQIKGHIKGRTLLPFPQGAANIDEEERKVRESDGKEVDTLLSSKCGGILNGLHSSKIQLELVSHQKLRATLRGWKTKQCLNWSKLK